MRGWVGLTNSPHVLVMRPLEAMRAGDTMNREAVALGTPVYTTFEGRLGAVDEALLHEAVCAGSPTRSR
jgi:predicted glycosyltransferase